MNALHEKFKKRVSTALKDELDAIKLYTEMIGMVPNPRIQQMIAEIRGDEQDHHRILLRIQEMVK